jgi:hypothetical protein
METATTPETYNPNQLVTYKKIPNYNKISQAEPEYVTLDVADLEWELHNLRLSSARRYELEGHVDEVKELMSDWYDSNYDKEEVLEAIANILQIEPTKTLRVTGNLSYIVDIEVPMNEIKDFDARYMLNDELILTSNTDVIQIESWNVDDADVEW